MPTLLPRTACLVVFVALIPRTASTASEFTEVVAPFLEEYCVDCHSDERPKGGLDLGALSPSFDTSEKIDLWQSVLERVELGEMPPRKKTQPPRESRERLSRWIRAQFEKAKIDPEIDHLQRSPGFGNRLDHTRLFDGSEAGPAYSRSRLWRLSPHVYDRIVDNLGEGVRHARTIHQPFAIDETKGAANDFAAMHFADSATLQLLMMNCRTIAEYQTTGIKRIDYKGRERLERRTPDAFRAVLESEGNPSEELLRLGIIHEYELLLERKPSEDEMQRALSLAERAIESAGKALGFQTVLMSILLKPEAVYRLEVGFGPKDEHGRRKLSPYELAFALSYALVDKGPSQVRFIDSRTEKETSLLEMAKSGQLSSPRDIRRIVRRILDDNDMSTADYTMFAEDHKVRNSRVLRFFREFFGYHHAPRVFKDAKRIGIDSGFETERIVHDADQFVMHIFDEDRDILKELLTSTKYFVAYPGSFEKFEKDLKYIRNNVNDANFKFNSKYVKRIEAAGKTPIPIEGPSTRSYVGFYNIDHKDWDFPTEQPFETPKSQRAGILTHPAWLIAWSGNFDNDPIRRGKWIREHLLADAVPDVPITVNAVVPEDPHKTLRQRLEATRAKECWTCHQKMNPLGLPFENFDDFGRFRESEMLGEMLTIFPDRHRDAKRVALDTSGEVIDSGEKALDGKVESAFELVDKLAESPRVRQSFVRHAFRFWLGRNERFDDSPTLIAADKAYVENGGSMKAMIAALLSSDSFVYRK